MNTLNKITPTTADIEKHLIKQTAKHGLFIATKRLAVSKGGRDILLARLTDSAYPDENKQHAFIVGGRHGNEESGRAQALALIDWLLTAQGRTLLKNQIVSVMPCANPDGTATDTYKNSDGINPFNDIESESIAAEGKAFMRALKNNEPDLFIDLHAKGHCGHSHDLVLHPKQRFYTEDFYITWDIMKDMAAAGEKATSIPHEIFCTEWPGWNSRGPAAMMYDHYKSIALLTESSESNDGCLPLKLRAKAGLERIKAALLWGQKRHPKLPYKGYPNQLVGASFNLGIVAIGKNPQERRKNRIKIWKQLDHFVRLKRQIPEEEHHKICRLEYAGAPLKNAVGIQIQVRGKLKIKSLTVNGKALSQKDSLFKKWSDEYSTFILVPIYGLKKGQYEIDVVYKP